MIFICNTMDCHDAVILLPVHDVKENGLISGDLCLLKILIISVVRVIKEVKSGPVVIRWSRRNSYCGTQRILIYSFIKIFGNYLNSGDLYKQIKPK